MTPSERRAMRVTVLVEDKRQERFVRGLLRELGFEVRNLTFFTAPSGSGAAEAWVRQRYPGEVKVLRSKNFQRSLGLLAMRDGDGVGVTGRKVELDDALVAGGLSKRSATERIATPVPTWSIETWLLALVGTAGVTEASSVKQQFHPTGSGEGEAITAAVANWAGSAAAMADLPSLVDGCAEVARLTT